MKANQLMTRDVLKCARGDSLEHATRTMWETDTVEVCGCVVRICTSSSTISRSMEPASFLVTRSLGAS